MSNVKISFWTPSEDDSGLIPYSTDDWMIDNEYEEIYNGEGRVAGERRYDRGSPGWFYQTYGNGGGPGGWGGYWIQDCNKSVWKVEGEVFTLLENVKFCLSGVPYEPASIHWYCKVLEMNGR
jgi:hypothetical protein